MDNSNVLIATHSLGIGGCETYVMTITKELIKRGYGVSIVAKDGILRPAIEKIGAKIYEIDFLNRSNMVENIENIKKIIKEDDIKHVMVQPFCPFFDAVVASIKQQIPYTLFFHGVSIEGYFDIRDCFGVLGIWSNIFIENIAMKYAQSFAYVSEETKDFYESKFGLEEQKGVILKNSVHIDEKIQPVNSIEKFLILTRIDTEKLNSIKAGINFYKEFYTRNKNKENLRLDIIGTGNCVDELKQFIEEDLNNYNINILEATDDTNAKIKNYDVLIGMGRSIIEAMSLKKFAILTNYDNYIGVINTTDNKIQKTAYANFSGRNMEKGNINSDIDYLLNLSKDQIIEIAENNYRYIEENNNISKNIIGFINSVKKDYINETKREKDLEEYLKLIKYINTINDQINNQAIEFKDKTENMQNKLDNFVAEIKTFENKNIIQQTQIEKLENQLNNANETIKDYNNRNDNQIKKIEEQQEKIRVFNLEIENYKKDIEKYKNMLNNIYSKKTYKIYRGLKKIIKKEQKY